MPLDTSNPLGVLDWSALGVIVILFAGALATARRGLTSAETLDQAFGERQRRARTSLEANHIVPGLAALLSDVAVRVPPWVLTATATEEMTSYVQDELQSYDYLDQLRQLGALAMEYDNVDSLYASAERWARRKGIAAVILAAALVYPALWIGIPSWRLPDAWTWVSSTIAIAALNAVGVCWTMETRCRTLLTRLCRRYQQ